MAIPTEYVPGVCNIGAEEIRRRRRSGLVALGFTAALYVLLLAIDAAPAWFAILFLPATAAALSLIQAAFRFCVYFGLSALFNFGRDGERSVVTDEDARARDRAASIRLIRYSMLAGAAFTALAIVSAGFA